MAETFKVGANARELLRYTQRATRIVTDDISRSDARKIIQKVAALEDVRDIQKVCGTAVHALDTRDREGFSKSTFRLYGEGIRLTARQSCWMHTRRTTSISRPTTTSALRRSAQLWTAALCCWNT